MAADIHPRQHTETAEAGRKRQQQRLRDTAAVTAGSGISLRLYLPAKAVQAALSAGLAALLAPYLLP